MSSVNKLGYCNECEEAVEFYIKEELVEEEFKGKQIKYRFKVGRCMCYRH